MKRNKPTLMTVTSGGQSKNIQVFSDEWSVTTDKFPVSSTGDRTTLAFRELSMNISGLRNDIQELTKVIKSSPLFHAEPEVVVYRDITKEQATKEISALLQAAEQEVYPSDICDTLRIDYDLVTEVLKELRAQGKVE